MSLGREFELITRISRRISHVLGRPGDGVELGIGDDTAILKPPASKLLATVDMLVEGVHFDLGYATFEDVGHKALAVNLSDVAAMGGTPLYALVSLGLRPNIDDISVERLYEGMVPLARRFGVEIVGGNIARSPERLLVDVTLLGEAARPATRAGAKPGDWIAVVGDLGSGRAGLAALQKWGRVAEKRFPELVRAQLRPEPRVIEGKALVDTGSVTAMIDISDGCANELHHLAERSGVGFLIEAAQLPIHEEARRLAGELGQEPLDWALQGGEDYGLLVCLSADKVEAARKLNYPLTLIGRVTAAREGIRLQDGRDLSPRGWSHL